MHHVLLIFDKLIELYDADDLCCLLSTVLWHKWQFDNIASDIT